MTVPCHYGCGHTVDPTDRGVYRRVTGGWERKSLNPNRKSGSDIVLRETADEFACSRCIERLRSGLSVGQEALL